MKKDGKKRFNFIIGNPPYQNDNDENSRKEPVYHIYMENVYKLADAIELITPARFLFDAGQTPKEWNQKMLQDKHLKILYYEKNASKIFSHTEIKGGVAISYYQHKKNFEPIEIFIPNKFVREIVNNIVDLAFISLSTIISQRGMYRFSDAFFDDDKKRIDKIAKGTGNMLTSRIFEVFPEEFSNLQTSGTLPIYGRINNQRTFKYISKKYIQNNDFINYYNVIIPEANGIGLLGESLSTLEILKPGAGHTDTFLSIGKFKTLSEAQNCLKYIKSKFTRTLLGVLKTTQHNPPSTWKYVPLQDFTSNSDIDWSKSIREIDRQLYKKYGLDDKEIEFIETHVKEME